MSKNFEAFLKRKLVLFFFVLIITSCHRPHRCLTTTDLLALVPDPIFLTPEADPWSSAPSEFLSATESSNCRPSENCTTDGLPPLTVVYVDSNPPSSSTLSPHSLKIMLCQFEPERGSIDATLADAAREMELALDILEVRVPFKSFHPA